MHGCMPNGASLAKGRGRKRDAMQMRMIWGNPRPARNYSPDGSSAGFSRQKLKRGGVWDGHWLKKPFRMSGISDVSLVHIEV